MSRIVIAGNWKMHHGPAATEAFLTAFLAELPGRSDAHTSDGPPNGGGVEIAIFPPSTSLERASGIVQAHPPTDPPVRVGAQQIHGEASGAFTGEISAELARDAGATMTLIGHSERRTLFGETDAGTALRVQAAYRSGLVPVLCVGETLDERRHGDLAHVLRRQLDAVLSPPELREAIEGADFVVAYEPVWAIGTGETATPDDAAEAHALIRERLIAHLGARGEVVPILYGGSVKPDNAGDLLDAPEVGGLLVGGASLVPDGFAAIVAAGRERAG